MQLSEKEAYQAMYKFLYDYYSLAPSEELGILLINITFFKDGLTADPAMWYEWIDCIKEIKKASE